MNFQIHLREEHLSNEWNQLISCLSAIELISRGQLIMFDEEICIILICYEFKKKSHSNDYGIAISLAQRPKVILQSRKLYRSRKLLRRAVSYNR